MDRVSNSYKYKTAFIILSLSLLFTVPSSNGADKNNATPNHDPIRLIVLDPGHGGKDSGAVGPTGLKEKDITLAIAKEIQKDLVRNMDVVVVLTRDSDKYLTLTERTDFANGLGADLFISLHINASRVSRPDGVETYFLSYDATDDDARRLAAFENGEGILSEVKNENFSDDLESILWDLTQTATHHESSTLAESIQNSLARMWKGEKRGVKQAHFKVLVGATMPAVLVEMGFISNPGEEDLLKDPHTHRRLAYAVTNGVIDFESATRKTLRKEKLNMGKTRK